MVAKEVVNDVLDNDGWENEAAMYEVESVKVSYSPKFWYSKLRYYLSTGDILIVLDAQKHRVLCFKPSRYQLVSRILF